MQQPAPADRQFETIKRALPLVLDLVQQIDPDIQVVLRPYRWQGQAMLDVGLVGSDAQHHLQVTAERLEMIEREPELLRHDIEGGILEVYGRGGQGAERRDGEGYIPPGPAEVAGVAPRLTDTLHIPSPGDPDLDPTRSPAALAVDVPHDAPHPARMDDLRPLADRQPVAPMVSRDDPHTGHVPRSVEPQEPAIQPEDRAALDETMDLVRHLVHELDPEATVMFEEYRWHGENLLDITIAMHGHTHHYELTASRAVIVLRAHELIEHDLEGIIRDLRREAAHSAH